MKSEKNTNTRSGPRQQQQTVQVKFGNQDATSMTPDQAAAYLKAIASSGWGVSAAKELKRNANGSSSASTNSAFNLAFAEANNILRNASSRNGSRVGASNSSSGSLPCSEKEMKALMSMFVEIMGLQMNTEKLNRVANSNLFQFPPDLPPPPGGWPSDLWPNEYGYDPPKKGDDDVDSTDSLPDLEEFEVAIHQDSKLPDEPPEPVTGKGGIARLDWEALEELAIEDALEQEERARKAAKKRQTSASRNVPTEEDRCVHEMEQREAEAEADRKREKTVLTWRNRVAAACQANEVRRLELLLIEAPLMKDYSPDFLRPHLDFFVPIILPKNRQLVEKNRSCREKLAEYLLNFSYIVMLVPQQNGRSGLHTCCFYGDVGVVQLILGAARDAQINSPCLESGWTPLHYAATSGSFRTVEALLAHGADILAVTSHNITWRSSNKKGITSKQLLDHILEGSVDKELETHGMALQEVKKTFVSNKQKWYKTSLEKILERLDEVETNGFTPLTKKQINRIEKSISTGEQSASILPNKLKPAKLELDITDPSQGKGDKNKPPVIPESPKVSQSECVCVTQEKDERVANDPVINALLGMGFEKQKIMMGVQACGGLDRATVDDVVAWIFGSQNEINHGQGESKTSPKNEKHDAKDVQPVRELPVTQKEDERALAVRLAAKREEQRRRNREWNLRQREEAQLKASATAEGKQGRLSAPRLPSRTLPQVTPLANQSSVSQLPMQKLSPPHTQDRRANADVRSYDAFETTNESFTVSSSIEIGSIDVGNDDCTVSTLGSHPTRSTPIPILPPLGTHAVAPPGFALPPGTEKFPPSPHDASLTPNASALLFGGSLQVSSPGIPESEPLLGNARSGSHGIGHETNLPYQPFENCAVAEGSGFLDRLPPPPSDYESSFFPSIPLAGVNVGRSLEQLSPGSTGVPPALAGQHMMNHSGYGLGNVALHPAQTAALDASIIDSISTGNELLPVPASLWGDAQASPSFLSNLIQVDDYHDDRQDGPRSGISTSLNGWSQPASTNFTGHGGSIW